MYLHIIIISRKRVNYQSSLLSFGWEQAKFFSCKDGHLLKCYVCDKKP